MIAGPILRRELRAVAGRRGLFVLRACLGVALAGLSLATVGLMETRRGPEAASLTPERLRQTGQAVLVMLAVLQVIAWAILIPGLVAGAIAEERQRGTLDALLLTRLSNAEILAHKLLGRLIPALSLILVGLPFLIAAGCCAGLPLMALALIVAMEAATVAFMGVLAIYASARSQTAGTARGLGLLLIWAWLLGPPMLAILPAGGVPLLAEVLAAIRSACALIAPSSPLSLVLPPYWFSAGGIGPLPGLAARMVAIQAALAAPALIGATIALGRRSGRPPVADPARDGRPACGDDPLFWKEFDLPNRAGSPASWRTLVRTWLTLVRVLVVGVFQLASLTLILAIPLGILAAGGHYGALAFREQWRYGIGSAEPFFERAAFNQVVRIVAGFSTFISLLSMAAGAAARITTERDKKTWEPLLTTPLSGREILIGKMRATIRTFRPFAWTAAALVVLGVAAGSINPLGGIWAVIDLPIAVWAGVSVGTWLGVRPGTTAAASSSASLVLVAVHLPLIGLALASGPEVASFGKMAGWFRLAVLSALLYVPPATGLLAWAVTRRTFARFDEWAGRPRRGGARPPSSAD